MRPSSLPPYVVSQLRPQDINLRDGERRSIRCPECQMWRIIRRGMVWPHHIEEGRRKPGERERCPGSARRVILDVTVDEWGESLCDVEALAKGRRSARRFHKPQPPSPEPLHRMADRSGTAPTAETSGRQHGRANGRKRAAQWRRVEGAVQGVDRERAALPRGAAQAEGPSVPLEPLRIIA